VCGAKKQTLDRRCKSAFIHETSTPEKYYGIPRIFVNAHGKSMFERFLEENKARK